MAFCTFLSLIKVAGQTTLLIRCLLRRPIFCFQAKELLKEAIDDFCRERISLAATAISNEALSKIDDGDVILIYSW